ncbi:putative subunit of benzoyl-CoA reductase/2-hydroxyglutaryl-CoA dehydratase [Candidatus Syntrophocurvum alkaliphilum]|uniref:Putative subunit of benzoyl-CoA reductase/2-hydroxyglutaryl-CoA dehydratase n=1 Tax=Candidatus Syntrophocurvum alkaliphilum TaxID=2293317 RepID=A0A6I6DDI8_9FIRM|nr:2-hydroxyacyl-CoA dehydratase [Candidatus Syntrophocurvum alkaliphilum]QGT98872.1 putative subunit of benzoyl-CoA reductase/2-hydroxyglutaryl-CoA dehydratase [Candidatus Syntrophocurvum alkaliphilum]
MSKIGFTTTVPVEIILAAGKIPVDLNNIFIGHDNPQSLVDVAEEVGYPRNTCGWIKGLYAVSIQDDLEAIVAVMQGDCSNTQALMETLQLKNIKLVPFAFPFDRNKNLLKIQMQTLIDFFNVDLSYVERIREELIPVRKLLHKLDEMTWKDNKVSGFENHYYLVSSSDFNGDVKKYNEDLNDFLETAKNRDPFKEKIRLAFMGVPPIITDLYQVLESLGARVVFNEVQRQFSMPFTASDIYDQYIQYTYPYGAFARLEDILPELEKRKIDGVIHYTQTFCFRQIEDIIYRENIKVPFITIEGDKPGKMDGRTRMRLEAFINMLK